MNPFREALRIVSLLGSILLVGVVGYHLIERWTLFDALYMTVITLATVGYGETHPLSTPGRVFTIFLILGGMGLSVVLHLLHFIFAQPAGRGDADGLFLSGAFVLCRHVQDPICVDIKCHLNLRNATRCRRYSVKVEFAKCTVVDRQRAFPLQDVDLD